LSLGFAVQLDASKPIAKDAMEAAWRKIRLLPASPTDTFTIYGTVTM
jgi:hypothetical protein